MGEKAAQIVHAAGESSRLAETLPTNTNAIALVAPCESELLAIEQKLKIAGIKFSAVREGDGKYTGQLMAIGCMPMPRDEVRRFFSSYPLIR